MHIMFNNYLKTISIAILTLLLFSCATTMEAQKNENKEKMLMAAGFKMKVADTPEKLGHLQALQQNKLVNHIKEGKNLFIYADATICKCMYVGGDESYSNYLNLQQQAKTISEQRELAGANEGAAINWGMWNPDGLGEYY